MTQKKHDSCVLDVLSLLRRYMAGGLPKKGGSLRKKGSGGLGRDSKLIGWVLGVFSDGCNRPEADAEYRIYVLFF